MGKKQADNRSVSNFFQGIAKLGGVSVSDAYDSGDTVDIYFDGKLTSTKQNKISSDVYAKLTENFDGTYELKKFKYDDGETLLGIKVSKSGVAGAVPTDIQEGWKHYTGEIVPYQKEKDYLKNISQE